MAGGLPRRLRRRLRHRQRLLEQQPGRDGPLQWVPAAGLEPRPRLGHIQLHERSVLIILTFMFSSYYYCIERHWATSQWETVAEFIDP